VIRNNASRRLGPFVALLTLFVGRSTAQAQLASPPMQLPTHSAFSEDAKPGVARLYDLRSIHEQAVVRPRSKVTGPITFVPATSATKATTAATPTPTPTPSSTPSAVAVPTIKAIAPNTKLLQSSDPFAPPVVSLPAAATIRTETVPALASTQPGVTSATTRPGTVPGLFASTTNVAMVPPSTNQRDYVPNPSYATSPLGAPSAEFVPPQEVPFFSWRPSYKHEGAKDGSFQQALGRMTYLPRIGDDGFGITSLNQQATFALPPFISGSPFLLTPSYTMHFLDGPGPIDVPPKLMDAELEFRYMKQATPRLGIDLAVAPSFFSDGDNTSSDAWRVTGRALGAWALNDRWQIVGGGVYTGRSDFPAVPVAGFIWKPSCDVRVEALFPRPKAYWRPFVNGKIEHWFYVGGEYGGNTWAIDHPGGIPDKMTYSDLRLLVGWERKAPGGLNGRFELGWVFDRSIEFTSGRPGFDPDDTLMVRSEFSF
jgi:hypothetical protein